MSEYKLLTAHFFKGTQKGQINSLWKKKDIKERIEEYKKALAAKHCKLDMPLNKGQVKRLEYMGIEIPDSLRPVKKERVAKPPRYVRFPAEVRLSHRQVDKLKTFGIEVPSEMMPLRKRKKSKAKQEPVEQLAPVPAVTSAEN